jgi:hypothetical protein
LSFLKQTHGPWTERGLAKALNLSFAEAKEAVSAMQLQGYIEPISRAQKWRTTDQGRTVSGAKSPRFTRDAIEQALAALSERIHVNNDDATSLYTVSEAVAFGDFLSDEPRVQAADVGIRLIPRKLEPDVSASAVEVKAEEAFLKQLRGRSAALHIQPYEDWMGARSHRKLK